MEKEIKEEKTFDYTVEQFADLQLLRYVVHGLRTCRWSKKNWFIIYHRQLWKVVIFCLTKMENIIWLSVGCLKQYIRIIRETVRMQILSIWRFI